MRKLVNHPNAWDWHSLSTCRSLTVPGEIRRVYAITSNSLRRKNPHEVRVREYSQWRQTISSPAPKRIFNLYLQDSALTHFERPSLLKNSCWRIGTSILHSVSGARLEPTKLFARQGTQQHRLKPRKMKRRYFCDDK